jgi:hypothetical protein
VETPPIPSVYMERIVPLFGCFDFAVFGVGIAGAFEGVALMGVHEWAIIN